MGLPSHYYTYILIPATGRQITTMASYLSSIKSSSALSSFSTRLNSFRRAITSAEEDDPEDADCSHISNVLRNYYLERGRRLPPWLPPDPKSSTPQPVPVHFVASNNSQSNYVGRPDLARTATTAPGGLGDLWGDNASSPALHTTTSLRTGRTPHHAPQGAASRLSPALSPPTRPVSATAVSDDYFAPKSSGGRSRSPAATPAGSYQSPAPLPNKGSAQDRLRARLQGRRS